MEARGSQAEATDCGRTGRRSPPRLHCGRMFQCVLEGEKKKKKTPFKFLKFLQQRNLTSMTLKTIMVFSGTRSSGCFTSWSRDRKNTFSLNHALLSSSAVVLSGPAAWNPSPSPSPARHPLHPQPPPPNPPLSNCYVI